MVDAECKTKANRPTVGRQGWDPYLRLVSSLLLSREVLRIRSIIVLRNLEHRALFIKGRKGKQFNRKVGAT